jgi:hypothetical protein
VLTKGEENQLLIFEEKVLQKSKMVSNRRRYNHELDKEFDSPNALNVTKTRLHHAGHMIRRPEDLYHKKPYSEPNLMEVEIKEDRNPGGRMG